jgi:hypothetical protein
MVYLVDVTFENDHHPSRIYLLRIFVMICKYAYLDFVKTNKVAHAGRWNDSVGVMKRLLLRE